MTYLSGSPKPSSEGGHPHLTGNSLRPRDVTRQARSTRQRTAGPGLGAGTRRRLLARGLRSHCPSCPWPGAAQGRAAAGDRFVETPSPSPPGCPEPRCASLTAGRGTWPWCDPAPHDCSCGFYHLWPPVKLPDCGLDYSTPSFRTKLRKSVVDTRYCYYSHVGLEDLVLTLEELKELGELNIKSSN